MMQTGRFLLCVCVLGGLPGAFAMAQESAETPTPEKKPEIEEIAEKPENQDNQNLKIQASKKGDGFNIVEFTASLLDFEGPPIPQRKPEYTGPTKTPAQKLSARLRAESDSEAPQRPLSGKQAELHKKIFEAQALGDFEKADALFEGVDDSRLVGHILYQRYMHKEYKSSFSELDEWLDHHKDLPGAHKIYALAQRKTPSGYNGRLQEPVKSRGVVRKQEPTMRMAKRYTSKKQRNDEQVRALNALNRSIFSHVRKGNPSQALSVLSAQGGILDRVERDLLKAEIAAGYLYENEFDKAKELATQSVKSSGLYVPKAGWVAGLIAWRKKKYSEAARHFEVVARSPYASGWTVAAGSYWAARAHMRMGNVRAVSLWLKRGVSQPRTFYGLLSTRALGRDFDFNWKIPPFTKDHLELLLKNPAADRGMALVMAGQIEEAEAELIRISPKDSKEYKALLAYAGYANLPALALRLGSAAAPNEGRYYDAALYPTSPWQIKEGYKIDPALVNAIMRQESRFNPWAKSRSGAQGLMQLMPATAKSLADKDELEMDSPETNLELGQRYLEELLQTSSVDGDLLYLLVAYNAGPGNLSKWKKRWKDVKDPLLFIELIPLSETRAYVERVLSNYWIYRLREGQETPTLDAIAAGQSAKYTL